MLSAANGISSDGTMIVGGTGSWQPVLWTESGGTWTIESLPGGATDVNDAGMVVAADGVWTKEFGTWTFHALTPLPGGTNILAWAINDHGDVVGRDEDGTGVMRAILWRKTPTGWAAPEYLGSLGGGSSATGVNNAGHVVGYSEVPGETHDDLRHQRAFLWTPLDGMVDLGSRDTDSIAWDINDLGQIVGASRKAAGGSGAFTAVLWELQ
jgi:probable HAF family extracellular repeat protein